jgi:hypothetical protein
MRKEFYKYCALSLLITTLWTLYGFFDYFLNDSSTSHRINSLVFYFYSIVAAISLGAIVLLLHLFFYFTKKSNHILNTFFYILAVVFNLYMALIWAICVYFGFLHAGMEFSFFILGALFISSFLAYDIYKIDFKGRSNKK